ncbi:MAG: diacylglycerol kinase [Proteobacteria bacterium]|nr:MAG: diacylglycerol kinase [Pseudomonadota bacterium]PIE65412.1 MAG: diacylglycerol kinase [Desulfobacterales bacterium]
MKSKKKGITRIWYAYNYSLAGLKAAYRHEAAFRQELLLFLLLLPVILIIPVSPIFTVLLFLVNGLVLIVELLNSAIETVVDMVSPDYHELAKRVKDIASAAVFISLLLAAVVWCSAGATILMRA